MCVFDTYHHSGSITLGCQHSILCCVVLDVLLVGLVGFVCTEFIFFPLKLVKIVSFHHSVHICPFCALNPFIPAVLVKLLKDCGLWCHQCGQRSIWLKYICVCVCEIMNFSSWSSVYPSILCTCLILRWYFAHSSKMRWLFGALPYVNHRLTRTSVLFKIRWD